MRRIGPRWRGRKCRLTKIFAPNESSNRALHVGKLTSLRECLDKKLQPFEHFRATFYVDFRYHLILDSELVELTYVLCPHVHIMGKCSELIGD